MLHLVVLLLSLRPVIIRNVSIMSPLMRHYSKLKTNWWTFFCINHIFITGRILVALLVRFLLTQYLSFWMMTMNTDIFQLWTKVILKSRPSIKILLGSLLIQQSCLSCLLVSEYFFSKDKFLSIVTPMSFSLSTFSNVSVLIHIFSWYICVLWIRFVIMINILYLALHLYIFNSKI